MIRVGLFIDTFFPMVDGVINVVDNYAKRLNDDEFEVIVFCPKSKNKKYIDNFPYPVKRCKSIKPFFLDYEVGLPKLDRKFKKFIDAQNLDIVHVHSPFGVGKMGIRYAKKHKIPCVITFHSQFKLDFERSVKWKFISNILLRSTVKVFNSTDECLTMNNFAKGILQDYGCKNNISIIRNACDTKDEHGKQHYINLANSEYNLNDEFVMLYVGRINLLKNLEFIVNSLTHLPENMNYKMIFAGDGNDRKYLENLVKKHNLENKVIFTGRILDREKLKALYARANLFVFPSIYDTDGIVKTEASCFSVPSVCLYNTGAGSLIENNVNGFLINQSEQELSSLMIKLEKDREFLNQIGENAKRDLYVTWDDIAIDLKQYYKKLLENYKK